MTAPIYTGATFKTLVANHLNRTDLTSLIPDFCALAIKELEKKKLWFQLVHQATLPTVANTGYSDLPTDFLFEIEKEIGESMVMPPTNYTLTKMDYPSIIYYQSAQGTPEQEPYYFAIMDKVYWYPIPNAIYNVKFSYYKHLAFPADGVGNDWTDTVWDMTFWAAIEEAWRYLGNPGEMAAARERKDKKMGEYLNQFGQRQAVGRIRLTSF